VPYKCSRCKRLYSSEKIDRHLCWLPRRRVLVAATVIVIAMVMGSVWMLA
jgi:hypothetical protein